MVIGLQIALCLCVVAICTLFTWYEGSGIITDSFEWNYSTPFSNMLHGEITQANELVIWDYFVYAAKFSPTYLIIMLVAGLYLLSLFGYMLSKKRKMFHLYLWGLSGVLALLSILFFGADTRGGKSFFLTFLLSGMACVISGWFVKNKLTIQSW
ncbi:DUF4306 domain-containing protein [Oceanobacillus sp. J11TS1]|uniref:DUF4306 domain-containing protein n=1 Tax=Oceanobacillus sp. J11TS1 TaxID=2807191 RepID=UPI001B022B04|nr:DUF4306 domain-containing protein [Oceanobacillus sp. J11TS1]GIO23055.1 hypothetical protein J11TS1_16360 [Oceanobacillus sp. J11TS1]